MEYLVLGAVAVRCRHGSVELTRPKTKVLLALLLNRANQEVQTAQLIEELWSGRPPRSARTAMRVHVTHLRQALASCPDASCAGAIEAKPASYQLQVALNACDALRLEDGIRAARDAYRAGVPSEAIIRLRPAIEAWRGPAYADMRDIDVIHTEATRLDELRLSGIELLADAYLAMDASDDACTLLESIVAEHPLRERIAEQLMLALYRSGRGADSLRVYSRLRVSLDSELGVAPGPSIRALEESIVVQRPELDAPSGPRRTYHRPDTPSMPIVGRRVELRALERAWHRTGDQGTTLMLVSGPAGIGKTTLVELAARRIRDLGGRTLLARWDPDQGNEYEPVVHLVRAALEVVDRASLRAPSLGELRRLVPDCDDLPPRPPDADQSSRRPSFFAAVAALVDRMPERVAVILEDLHWAGQDALALLHYLTVTCGQSLLVIGTHRVEDLGDTPLERALAEGRLAPTVEHLRVDGLDINELTALVRAGDPPEVRAPLLGQVSELHSLTQGNPLFVREAIQAFADSGCRTPVEQLTPGGVIAVVQRRLRHLSSSVRGALEVAAVMGHTFGVPALAAVLDCSEDEAIKAAEAGARAHLVQETDEVDMFTFSHPVFRNAVYSMLSTSRRRRLHLRMATIHERSHPVRWTEASRHRQAALPIGSAKLAASAAMHAGKDAEDRYAFEEAASWYRDAITIAGEAGWSSSEIGRAVLRQGMAIEQAGRRSAARDLYLHAAEHGRASADYDLLADAAIAATPRYVTVDPFRPTQRALVEEALEHAASGDRRRAWLLCCASATRYYDERGDQPYAHDAMAMARRSEDPEVQAVGLLTYHRWLTHDPLTGPQRLALSRELLAVCHKAGLDSFTGRAYRTLLIDLLSSGRFDEFDDELPTFDRFARTRNVPADIYWAAVFRATRALTVDPHVEAEDLIRAARTIGHEYQQGEAEGTFLLQSFALHFQQGRPHEISKILDTPDTSQPRILSGLAVVAAAAASAGRQDPACKLLDRTIADDTVNLELDNLWLGAVTLYASAAIDIGTRAQQAVLLKVLAPFADSWCVFAAGAAVFATGHYWIGRLHAALGDTDAAASHLQVAVSQAQQAGAAYWEGAALHTLSLLPTRD